MNDPRPKHALILGSLFTIGAPVVFLASYYQALLEFRAIGADQYAWKPAMERLPDCLATLFAGLIGLAIWTTFKQKYKYSPQIWTGYMAVLFSITLISLIIDFQFALLLKLAILAYFFSFAWRLGNTNTENSEPNP